MRKPLVVMFAALLAAPVFALDATEASFGTPFTSHAVLQRDCKLPVWGFATPGATVGVRLDRRTLTAVADEKGRWKVEFPPMKAGLGHTLTLTSGSRTFADLDDIAVGDVWICSGQSNMAMNWHGGLTRGKEEMEKNAYWNLRVFGMCEAFSFDPVDRYGRPAEWQHANIDSVRGFSACGYFFGVELMKQLGDVPIGLVNASWGGDGGFLTGNAADLALAGAGATVALAGDWKVKYFPFDAQPFDAGQIQYWTPAVCYNAMIHPLFPMALKGALWYQGCSDVGAAERYDHQIRALAKDWRSHFTHDGEMGFYIVQLAAFQRTNDQPVESEWAKMRWTQMRLGETLGASGTAVVIDVGEHDNIHPHDKKTPGERLARLALARTYGRKDIVEAGPIPTAAKSGKAGGAPVVGVVFKNAKGLKTSDGGKVKGFQLAGADGRFAWAEAKVVKDKIAVSVPDGLAPTRVRYAWDDYPDCNLVNAEGLPCGPFELMVQ